MKTEDLYNEIVAADSAFAAIPEARVLAVIRRVQADALASREERSKSAGGAYGDWVRHRHVRSDYHVSRDPFIAGWHAAGGD